MSKPASLGRKLAFASCDVACGGSFNIVNFFYVPFLALVVGLPPFWIGFVMLVARVWDAISDPLMGFLSDRTSSRFGKRRIYLLVASPLIAAATFLLFFPYSFSELALRVAAVLASYLLFCTIQTMIAIPYYSLSGEISSDYAQRASFNSWRLGFSIASSLVCIAVPGILLDSLPDRTGYMVVGGVFGALFAVAVLITGAFSREEIKTAPSAERFSLGEYLKFFSIRPFRQYLAMLFCSYMTMTIMSSLFFFFVDFYINRTATAAGDSGLTATIAAALMFGVQIVALPFYLMLIRKKSKAFAYRAGAFVWIAVGLLIWLLPADCPPALLYLAAMAMGFGISGPGLAPHTIFGDVADAAALVHGSRSEGKISGIVNFFNKAAQALVIAVIMNVLGLCGFQETPAGAPRITQQPLSAQFALRAVMALSPLIIMGIGIAVSTRYRIDAKKQQAVADALERGGPDSDRLVEEFTGKR